MEHRKEYTHFKPVKKVFAALLPDYGRLGEVIDIGMDGFTIQYLDSGNPPKESQEIYWLFTKDGFFMDRVKVKVVSDIEIKTDRHKARKKQVEFLDLTSDMKDQLKHIIENYTMPYP